LFNERKHRTFNYQPRFSEEAGTNSSKDNSPDTKEFVSKWRRANNSKLKVRGAMSIKILILILVLLLVCMYVLEKKYM